MFLPDVFKIDNGKSSIEGFRGLAGSDLTCHNLSAIYSTGSNMFACKLHLKFESDRICHVFAKSDFLITRPHFPVATVRLLCLVAVKSKGHMEKLKLAIVRKHAVVTVRKQSLGQGNVFTPVCQYFCSQFTEY